MMCSLASESNARLLLYLTTAAYVRADEQWLIRSLHFCSCVFGLGKVIFKKIHSANCAEYQSYYSSMCNSLTYGDIQSSTDLLCLVTVAKWTIAVQGMGLSPPNNHPCTHTTLYSQPINAAEKLNKLNNLTKPKIRKT